MEPAQKMRKRKRLIPEKAAKPRKIKSRKVAGVDSSGEKKAKLRPKKASLSIFRSASYFKILLFFFAVGSF